MQSHITLNGKNIFVQSMMCFEPVLMFWEERDTKNSYISMGYEYDYSDYLDYLEENNIPIEQNTFYKPVINPNDIDLDF